MEISANTEFADQYIKGEERYTYNRYGEITRIYVPFTHKTLKIFKEISGSDGYTIQSKFEQLVASWDAKYRTYLEKQKAQEGATLAEDMQLENEQKLYELSTVLAHTLDVDDEVDWNSIKSKPNPPEAPSKEDYPSLPYMVKPAFNDPSLKMGFFAGLFGTKKKAHLQAKADHEIALKKSEAKYLKDKQAHDAACSKIDEKHKAELAAHEAQVEKHLAEVEAHNLKIDQFKLRWTEGDADAVVEHACLVLDASEYPNWINTSYQLQYDANEKLLKVQFLLPSLETVDIPKTVRFVKSTGELKETSRPKKEQQEYFDSLCYQIALRTVHELYEADTPENINNILFNGIVESIDPATGNQASTTIMSAVFDRAKFIAVNLDRVEPKACFKSFNGVSASSLAGLAPIAPVMEFDTSDRRFIDGRVVSDDQAGLSNLASMSWEDFEHLVREVFSKEFEARGGEVKVTQSSSDGGVDAIAFDPDPISGGKIVIQSKRYTKTVGVSAVRDLYGTLLNEGASKGILVTTADYGPDAYKFAADKPISLLNGANLLYLLERHGMEAKIDLKAARQELGLK